MNNPIYSECNVSPAQHKCVVCKIKLVYPKCCEKRGNNDLNKIACKDFDVKNNLIDEAVNRLTQLSHSTALTGIDSVQVHSLEISNPEVIEVPPQQDNANTNYEQVDTNVNTNDSFAEIRSLELVTALTNDLPTNTNGQILATTNDNSRHLSQVSTPAMCQFSASNEGYLEDGHDSEVELVPFYDAVDGMVKILEDEEPQVESLGTLSIMEIPPEAATELSSAPKPLHPLLLHLDMSILVVSSRILIFILIKNSKEKIIPLP